MQRLITWIRGGQVYTPEPAGKADVLMIGGQIIRIGKVDGKAVEALGAGIHELSADGCVVVPGLIDPHEHLLGGSGEKGFSSQTPEIFLPELLSSGITTVVGCLGVDTRTKTLAGLLAKVKALREEGVTAFMWSGGYCMPPVCVMTTLREDMLFIDEVIGAGEVAIADRRAVDPTTHELARLIIDVRNGGLLTRKSGVTHFHVGEGKARLEPLRKLLDEHEIDPACLYPTHVERSRELMEEAIELTHRGVTVDVDVMEKDLAKWLKVYRDSGADPERLTISTDSGIGSPRLLLEQVRACVQKGEMPLETVLPHATTNTARVLKLERKGRLAPGLDGDVAVLRKSSLELVHVVANGQPMVVDGKQIRAEQFREESDRAMSPML